MNRALLSALIWLSLAGAALAQSIGPSPGNPNAVVGPASSTDNAVVRWDGATGTLVQNSRTISSDIGSLLLGSTDAAAPDAQSITVQGVLAGTANTAGVNLTIAGSRSTGSAAGGSIIFQTAAAGGAGSAQNALATALTIASTKDATLVGALSAAGLNSLNGANVVASAGVGAGGFYMSSDYTLGWSSQSSGGGSIFSGTKDLTLFRDAANTFALRNGVNPQTANFYGTWTDASNKDYASITKAAGGAATISTVGAGTGTGGDLIFGVPVTAGAGVATTSVWKIGAGASAGALLAVTDNTYDIGASGARPRNVFVAASVTAGNNVAAGNFLTATTGILLNGQVYIQPQGDGNLSLENAAQTSFGRLQLGGTTSSFPALARNGIKIDVKLADDSTYAPIAASAHIAAGAVPTLALAGGTCAGTVIAGGASAGTVTLTGACASTNTMTLTVMPTVPNGYACDAVDRTTKTIILAQSATTTSGATFTFSNTTGATDVIAYKCIGY